MQVFIKRLNIFCGAVVLMAALPSTLTAQSEPYSSFNEAGYTKPLVTLMGTLMNSSWYQSGRVGKNFGFQISLPVTLGYPSSEDYFYTTHQPTNCAISRQMQSTVSCSDPDYRAYTVPTIIGPDAGDQQFQSHLLNAQGEPTGSFILTPPGHGLQEFRNWRVFPFLIPHLSLSSHYTELKLRYIPISLGFTGIDLSGQLMGAGLQHDLTSLFKGLPVVLSLGASISYWGFDFTPEGYTGALELSGLTTFTGLLVSKQWGPAEIFLETGWETAGMDLGGQLVDVDDPQDITSPDVSVAGRNGIRAALNVSMHFGYHPVVGQGLGAQLSNQFNLLIFKKESE